MNVGIVILNYLAYEATINCINSFKKQNRSNVNMEIVVVDNASPNESLELLTKEFMGESHIHIFGLKENIGFAKGNNYGYEKLLELFQPDYVIISNDDIMIEQDGLFQWIHECYTRYHFAVLGPEIYSVNGKFHQNPGEVLNQNKYKCTYMLWNSIFKRKRFELCKFFSSKEKEKQIITVWDNQYYQEFHDDKTLHGSFQIFSKDYFKHYAEPYHPGTFLYMEEDLVRLRCDKKGLRMCYVPGFKVNHLQAMSSVLDKGSAYEKKISRLKHIENSMKVYIRELDKG